MKIINSLLDLVEKHLVGPLNQKIGKSKYYLHCPKLGPFFTLAFIVAYLGQYKFEITWLMVIGYVMIVISVFAFFFYKIFPSRIPKLERPNIKE